MSVNREEVSQGWLKQMGHGDQPFVTVINLLRMEIMNRALKSLLKTALYTIDQVDSVSDQVSNLTERGRAMITRRRSHWLSNSAIFAIGVGVGIGVGFLFAPTSGEETRKSISEKVRDIGDRMREGLPAELPRTGTESV
jgi:hypothetical protein